MVIHSDRQRALRIFLTDDVLIELLSHSPDWQTDEEALDFIIAHKLQVLRKLKQIGTIVKQAKRKRAQLVTANR